MGTGRRSLYCIILPVDTISTISLVDALCAMVDAVCQRGASLMLPDREPQGQTRGGIVATFDGAFFRDEIRQPCFVYGMVMVRSPDRF